MTGPGCPTLHRKEFVEVADNDCLPGVPDDASTEHSKFLGSPDRGDACAHRA